MPRYAISSPHTPFKDAYRLLLMSPLDVVAPLARYASMMLPRVARAALLAARYAPR